MAAAPPALPDELRSSSSSASHPTTRPASSAPPSSARPGATMSPALDSAAASTSSTGHPPCSASSSRTGETSASPASTPAPLRPSPSPYQRFDQMGRSCSRVYHYQHGLWSMDMDESCYVKLKRRLILRVMFPSLRAHEMKNPQRVQVGPAKLMLGTEKTSGSNVDGAPPSEKGMSMTFYSYGIISQTSCGIN